MSFISSLILPTWLYTALSHLDIIVPTVLATHFVMSSDGVIKSIFRLLFLTAVAVAAVAVWQIVSENLPSNQPVAQKQHYFWGGD